MKKTIQALCIFISLPVLVVGAILGWLWLILSTGFDIGHDFGRRIE